MDYVLDARPNDQAMTPSRVHRRVHGLLDPVRTEIFGRSTTICDDTHCGKHLVPGTQVLQVVRRMCIVPPHSCQVKELKKEYSSSIDNGTAGDMHNRRTRHQYVNSLLLLGKRKITGKFVYGTNTMRPTMSEGKSFALNYAANAAARFRKVNRMWYRLATTALSLTIISE